MRLQAHGKDWVMHVHHGSDVDDRITAPEHIAERFEGRVIPIRFTSCTLHEGRCPQQDGTCGASPVYTAIAWCSPLDNFVRGYGLYLAFKRAADKLPDRRTRAALWDSFRKQVNIPKKAKAA